MQDNNLLTTLNLYHPGENKEMRKNRKSAFADLSEYSFRKVDFFKFFIIY